LARDQFAEAMNRPNDPRWPWSTSFLVLRNKDGSRRGASSTAYARPATHRERAFRNIDAPLAAGIERWKKAIEMGADNFSAHFELATLAEQRDELALAAEQL